MSREQTRRDAVENLAATIRSRPDAAAARLLALLSELEQAEQREAGERRDAGSWECRESEVPGESHIERGAGADTERFLDAPLPYPDAEKVERALSELEQAERKLEEAGHEHSCTIYNANPPWRCNCAVARLEQAKRERDERPKKEAYDAAIKRITVVEERLREILEIAKAPGFATRSGEPRDALDEIVRILEGE